MYILNSNGNYVRKQMFVRDNNQQSNHQNEYNEQARIMNSTTNDYSQLNYSMKQYVDEHITNDIWVSNGSNGDVNSNNWNDGFSESMKSSQWNDHGLYNRQGTTWEEYTQKRNPWV